MSAAGGADGGARRCILAAKMRGRAVPGVAAQSSIFLIHSFMSPRQNRFQPARVRTRLGAASQENRRGFCKLGGIAFAGDRIEMSRFIRGRSSVG